MGVKVEFDEVLKFYRDFQREFLEPVKYAADRLEKDAQVASATFGGTKFATKAEEGVATAAKKIKAIVAQGEEQVRQLERITKMQADELSQFER